MPDPQAQQAWSPSSWRRKETLQQPTYPDSAALEETLAKLSGLPPLVTSWEIERLNHQLAEVAEGKRFLLQGGDCAESLADCESGVITRRLKILLQMSLVLVYGLRLPVVRVGRFAGQYAKPRSADNETRGGVTLPAYRGDIVNRPGFSESDRVPDPQYMLEAYSASALTLNFVRALAAGGFADLHHPEYWDVDFLKHSPMEDEYEAIVDEIGSALMFMEIVHGAPIEGLSTVEFFTSHEALLLPYEQALTRAVPHNTGIYNLSTHFPWVGVRTAHVDSAHVEYARGLANPIAIKVGPDTTPDELVQLTEVLSPQNKPGRITLITRLGSLRVADHLPRLVRAVVEEGRRVIWCCDPMHGNTEITADGVKTRRFENIMSELTQAFEIHNSLGSRLNGVHIELTGDDVTECVGGARGLRESDLGRSYKSAVDPRLNAEQALELAFEIVRQIQRDRQSA
ncbi:MAG: 3-deoxy-7-phosphoheptulonate synthase class II [Rhodothermales bacterium]|nr:3-deoxy-7-phosphoheptulonate synthase class II [Rhodothermales bacterium]